MKLKISSKNMSKYLPNFMKIWIREGRFPKMIVYLVTGVLFSIFIVLAVFSFLGMIKYGQTPDYIVLAVLSSTATYGLYDYYRMKRIREIDKRIPDFLRDLAESRKAGMTFTSAIMLASKGDYGVLTNEIKKMAQQISWGSSVSEALETFAKRVDTHLAKRAASLINEASRSGGSVAEILNAAARDTREIEEVKAERKIEMISYVAVVYVAAFVFLAVVAIVCSTFLPAMIQTSVSELPAFGGFSMGGGADVNEVLSLFYYAALIQGFGSGMVAGIFESGEYSSGIKHAFVLVLISWIVFKLFIHV
jgi:flagellar protein FlaJ